jgi:hypothetical protein
MAEIASHQQMAQLYSRADSLPAEARERLRDINVILRHGQPATGTVVQCHFFLWGVPVRKPKPGLLACGADIRSGFRGRQCGSIDDLRVFLGFGREDVDVRSTAARLHSAMIQECGNNGTVLPDCRGHRRGDG